MPEVKTEVTIKDLLKIDSTHLEEDLASCPSYNYYYMEQSLDTEEMYNRAVLNLEMYEFELGEKLKKDHMKGQEGGKWKPEALKETELKRMFRGDATWLKLKDEEIELYTKYKKLRAAAEAFKDKNLSCTAINKRQLFRAEKGFGDE